MRKAILRRSQFLLPVDNAAHGRPRVDRPSPLHSGSQQPAGPLALSQLSLLGGSAIAGILALSLTVYVCYRFAKRTIALIGGNGINVVVRLSAFILLCIGIQVLWTGYPPAKPGALGLGPLKAARWGR